MNDRSIITKFELSPHEEELKSKFFSPSKEQVTNKDIDNNYMQNKPPINFNENSDFESIKKQMKNPILRETKTSINNIINFERSHNVKENKSNSQNQIKQMLLPIYEQVEEIKKEIQFMQKYTQADFAKKGNQKLSENDINNIYNLNEKFQRDLLNVNEAMDYVNKNTNQQELEDNELTKGINEIKEIFSQLRNEMLNIQNDFNEKFNLVVKEKNRQKIADDLLKGNYNANNEYVKILTTNGDFGATSTILDKIDYDDYKNEMNDIIYEKDKIMNIYNAEKMSLYEGLPKLVNPKSKIHFNYELNDGSKEHEPTKSKSKVSKGKKENYISENKNKETNQNNQGSGSNMISTKAYSNVNSNNNSSKQKKSNNRNYQSKSNSNNPILVNIKEETNSNIEEENKNNYSKMSPQDKMLAFQNKMNKESSKIKTERPKGPPPPRHILIGPSKEDIIRGKQPRSSKCKITLQDFKKKKRCPIYKYESYPEQKKSFRLGLYPSELCDPIQYPKVVPNDENMELSQYKIAYPYGVPERDLKNVIERLIEINIKDQIKKAQPKGSLRERSKIDLERQHKLNEGGNEELIKLLIDKFQDLENAIKGNWNKRDNRNYQQPPYSVDNLNNGQRGRKTEDINEDIAEEIYRQMKSELTININMDGENANYAGMRVNNENEEVNFNERSQQQQQSENNQPFRNVNTSRIKSKREQTKESEEKKKEEEKQPIPIFDEKNNIQIEQLDKMIEMPHKIDLDDFDVSKTSSYISEAKQKEIQYEVPQTQKKEDTSNSLSKGQVNTESDYDESLRYLSKYREEEESSKEISISKKEESSYPQSESEKKREKAPMIHKNLMKEEPNIFSNVKNRTPLDLLMVKAYNERLPEQIIGRGNQNANISNIEHVNEEEEYDELSSFGSSFSKNAKEVVDINNNARLKLLELYDSKEYNDFKNNYYNRTNQNQNQNRTNMNLLSFGNQQSSEYNQFIRSQNGDFEEILKKHKISKEKYSKKNEEEINTISEKSELEKGASSGINQSSLIPSKEKKNITESMKYRSEGEIDDESEES